MHLLLDFGHGVLPPPGGNSILVELVNFRSGSPAISGLLLDARIAYPFVSGMYSHMRIQIGTEKAPYTNAVFKSRASSMGGVA